MTIQVMITGGGTGGHVFPAVAIAEALLVARSDLAVTSVGMADSMEARAAAAHGWPFIALPAAPIKGRGWWQRGRALGTIARAVGAAWRLLGRTRPQLVIGTGGYVSAPLMVAAALRGIPTMIHEQNSVPGLTNRWVGRMVRAICTTVPSSQRWFPTAKVVHTGMPVRAPIRALHAAPRTPHRAPWTVLIMGGSQGARRINELMIGALPALRASGLVGHVIHQVGKGSDPEAMAAAYRAQGVSAEVHPFIERMADVYARADLAVCRSGAASLAELACAGLPAVLIPFPFAADDHQTGNARALATGGGAVVLAERELTSETLWTHCAALLGDAEQLAGMRAAMHGQAVPDAAERIVATALSLIDATRDRRHRTAASLAAM